jgi:hypothetical protein
LAINFSDCGFLFISERDAMEFSPSFEFYPFLRTLHSPLG